MNEIELNTQNKTLNETEKELQILLKNAGVDEIGEKLLKEVEDVNKTENFMHQNEIQTMKDATGFISNAKDTISSFFKDLEPYLLPFKIIIKRADNTLSGIDALIEYQKTKDGLKVSVKIGSEIIASQLFAIGTRIVIQAAISAFVAVAIYTSSILLGVLAAISIVGIGMIILWWINSKIEDWLKDSGISFIDFIREYETHLSSEEKYYHNLAHCHQTQIKNMQRIQLYYNGKISEDLKHYYYPFYDFKKAPILDGKDIIKRINELQNNYKILSPKDTIDNIHINSEFYLLKALYFCEDYVLYDKDKQALFDENTIKELEFNSSFYTIFISHKNKLNDTYLKARKELYKSIDEFKRLGFKDLENAYQTYMSSFIINEELNNKDKTINKNENKEINKNSNQENNIKENTSSIIKNTNFNNETSLKTKQSNTIIDDIKEDFKIVSNNAIINNTNFKGKKIA
ncbi:hypothetical protein A17_01893 (plasmid) [Campylobacter jejuni subsp. jejuni]|uniref:hypothetical protein n=1 Tax=Campylobacter jejuni TaxID=197 RepID=UPI000F8545CF|nr:hypothetical protein [Campylobacter jejuni]AZR09697.1 hypothetical protein A17_01893 [Campylobacter jejuni subsp. jejuni]